MTVKKLFAHPEKIKLIMNPMAEEAAEVIIEFAEFDRMMMALDIAEELINSMTISKPDGTTTNNHNEIIEEAVKMWQDSGEDDELFS